MEEIRPKIRLLRVKAAGNNVASFNTARALGFEYEGKTLIYKRVNNEDKYVFENHFAKRIFE